MPIWPRCAHMFLCFIAASCATPGPSPIRSLSHSEAAPRPVTPYEFGAASQLILNNGQAVGSVRAAPWPRSVALGVVADAFPPGNYRTYLHAKGRCDSPDFSSAGPAQVGNKDRLAPADLGQIAVRTDGRIYVTKLADGMKLRASDPGGLSILLDADGAALIIHAGETRVACAVLK